MNDTKNYFNATRKQKKVFADYPAEKIKKLIILCEIKEKEL